MNDAAAGDGQEGSFPRRENHGVKLNVFDLATKLASHRDVPENTPPDNPLVPAAPLVSTFGDAPMEERTTSPAGFARSRLPWVVAVAAFALYLATISKWVTFASLPVVATVTGWNWWEPVLVKPLFHLLASPVRWLPAGAQPLALNFFSAVCAALTLALLARSVAIFPHDRTREQRHRVRDENALLDIRVNWVPPLLAVFVLGLQLTFWENATAATGEMLNLLVFAALIRCLLEFRLTRNDSWLSKFALLYGFGAADNHALVGFFPLALGALVALKGRGVLKGRFIRGMLAWGLPGLLLYLLPPWMVLRDPENAATFLELIRIELGAQKHNLLGFPRSRVLLLALVSVVPALLMSIRWPAASGDTSATGAALTSFLLRVVQAAFLAVGVWVAFDPLFGPRALGFGVPFLTFSHLGALAVGYFAGCFLLLAADSGGQKSWRQESLLLRAINQLCAAAVCVALVAVPLMLAKKNLPAVRAQNGPALRQFAEMGRTMLPEKAVLLSERPDLLMLQAAVADPTRPAPALVDLRYLPRVAFHRKLARQHPGLWPAPAASQPGTNFFSAVQLTHMLGAISATNPLVYLHPAWGSPIFETHHLVPRGVIYGLRPYAPGVMTPPPPTGAEAGANQGLWGTAIAGFPALREGMLSKSPAGVALAGLCSTALNYWGVELQRAGMLSEAQRAFAACVQLNTNPAARLNLQINDALRSGKPVGTTFAALSSELIREAGTWLSLFTMHGPVDEPELAFQLGRAFQAGALQRQAIQQLSRAQALNPSHFAVRYTIAESLMQAHRTDAAEAAVRALRAAPEFRGEVLANEAMLLRLDGLAQLQRTNFAAAETILVRARALQPRNTAVLETLFQVQMFANHFTNAVATLEALLQVTPDDLRALSNLGSLLARTGQPDRALAPLDRALNLQPGHVNALINRGLVHFTLGRLDAAERDYSELGKAAPNLPAGHFGLAEIALKRNQPAEACRHFERGLRVASPDAPDAVRAKDRLKQLQGANK